jgi:hypothetical protein
MLALRYLEFIPFIDRNYFTPIGYKYFVHLFDGQKEIHTKMNSEFSGYHNEMLQSGGVQVFLIPKEVTDLSNLTIKIRVKKNDWKSARLEADDDVWQRMPRSRDFQIDGHILFERLKKRICWFKLQKWQIDLYRHN